MFLSPWGLLGLISLPLIILLYILKQKREKVTVSSLILWSRVLEDMKAKTPWQKLRKNLLLFLQLLSALLIVLALAGFAITSGTGSDRSVILVIDCSLSMSSSDIRPTRLEAAKKDAVKYITELPRDSRVTVVRAGTEPEVLLYASASRDEIRRSIEAIEQTMGYLDAAEAGDLILSLKKQDAGADIVLFGDQPIQVGNETVQFSNYRMNSGNLALIRLTHSRTGDQITGMSVVRNQGDSDAEASVSLYGDNMLIDSQRAVIPRNGTQTIWWRSIPDDVTTLRCVIDTEDILNADNHAYDVIKSGKPAKVLLATDGNLFLEKVLSLIEGVELTRTLPEEITGYKGFDLYVLDGTIPEKLPEDGNIIIFAPPANPHLPVGDWMTTADTTPVKHQVFRYLDKLTFSIGRTRIMEKPEWADSVMEYNGNPIILDGRIGNTRLLVFGFSLYETDLPLKSEFPILMSNIISEYAPNRGFDITGTVTGEQVQFNLLPDTGSASVILPDGTVIGVAPPIPPEPFIYTGSPGIYRLEQKKAEETLESLFAVNLADEWLMENRESLISNGEETAAAYMPLQKKGTKMTLPLLAAVLIILLLEWWYYANRNYA